MRVTIECYGASARWCGSDAITLDLFDGATGVDALDDGDLIVRRFNEIGMKCHLPRGSFYAFPDVSGLIAAKGLADDLVLADVLLKDSLVALVPGSAFGTPGHMRLSFATSDKVLVESLKRIDEYARG